MARDDEEHVYGRVPRSRRPLFAWILGVAGVLVIGGGVLASWLTNSPVHWGWLVAIVGIVMLIVAIYLWIRLSD